MLGPFATNEWVAIGWTYGLPAGLVLLGFYLFFRGGSKKPSEPASPQAASPVVETGFRSRILTSKQLSIVGTHHFIVPEGVYTVKVSIYGPGGGGAHGLLEAGRAGGSTAMAQQTVTGGEGGRIDNQRAKDGAPHGGEIGRRGAGARGGEGSPDHLGRLGQAGAYGGFCSFVKHVSPGDKLLYVIGGGGRGAANAQDGQNGYIIVEY